MPGNESDGQESRKPCPNYPKLRLLLEVYEGLW
jgi:hypothetical protein